MDSPTTAVLATPLELIFPTPQLFLSPSQEPPPYSNIFFQVFFSRGGDFQANLINSIPGSYPSTDPPQLVGLLRMQHADCPSFDIDRAPYTTPANRNFSAD